jgi:hypothetical protein
MWQVHKLPLPNTVMNRLIITLALLSASTLSVAADEWADLQAQYQNVTVIGGLGLGDGPSNPNEWNGAEGAQALTAELSEPHNAMEDIHGRVFIADKNAHTIRRIDLDGTIHTVAGMNLDEIPGGGTNSGFNNDGPARERLLNGPQHAYVMPDGSFYILDSSNFRVRRVDAAGNLTTIVNDTALLSRGLWVSRNEQVIYYCSLFQLKRWTPANGSGPGTVVATGFSQASNIDVDASGNVYVSDRTLCGVYRIPPNHGGAAVTDSLRVAGLGNGSTVDSSSASNGTIATAVGMREARGVAFHPLGGFFVATHRGGDIWYVDSAGLAWMFVQGNNGSVHVAEDTTVPTSVLVMSEPRSVTVGISGNILIACNDSGYIRKVPSTVPLTAAPSGLTPSLTSSGMGLTWQSTSGRWYYIERSSSLGSATWTGIKWLPATGVQSSFEDLTAAGNRLFYRIREFRGWPN